MQNTPKSESKHICIFGRVNTGKSSLINFLTNQDISIVSDRKGTTTDPVHKNIEIIDIGACTLIDTAGFDDITELSKDRIKKTEKVLLETDLALLLINECKFDFEKQWVKKFKKFEIPFICIVNKLDCIEDRQRISTMIEENFNVKPIFISCKEKIGLDEIILNIKEKLISSTELEITSPLVKENDLVLLVMPQDKQAPKKRLILPQVQVLRELLDKNCNVVSTSSSDISGVLKNLSKSPDVIITDSQIFKEVYDQKPIDSKISSFSILFAAYKGDINYYLQGIKVLEKLDHNAKIIISEACTHNPTDGDIGREKIPNLLRKKLGDTIEITITFGDNFPENLEEYDLIIQCGACMFNRKHVINIINIAKEKNIAMTNYGVVIAYLTGILDKIDI